MKFVLDASAVLALLNDETGADIVAERLNEDSVICAVNAAEVGTKLTDAGMSPAAAWEAIRILPLRLVDFDADIAQQVVELRAATTRIGLSLGDRTCLGLAVLEGATAVTADRAWGGLEIGCRIELIR